jgi:hypothetical protein
MSQYFFFCANVLKNVNRPHHPPVAAAAAAAAAAQPSAQPPPAAQQQQPVLALAVQPVSSAYYPWGGHHPPPHPFNHGPAPPGHYPSSPSSHFPAPLQQASAAGTVIFWDFVDALPAGTDEVQVAYGFAREDSGGDVRAIPPVAVHAPTSTAVFALKRRFPRAELDAGRAILVEVQAAERPGVAARGIGWTVIPVSELLGTTGQSQSQPPTTVYWRLPIFAAPMIAPVPPMSLQDVAAAPRVANTHLCVRLAPEGAAAQIEEAVPVDSNLIGSLRYQVPASLVARPGWRGGAGSFVVPPIISRGGQQANHDVDHNHQHRQLDPTAAANGPSTTAIPMGAGAVAAAAAAAASDAVNAVPGLALGAAAETASAKDRGTTHPGGELATPLTRGRLGTPQQRSALGTPQQRSALGTPQQRSALGTPQQRSNLPGSVAATTFRQAIPQPHPAGSVQIGVTHRSALGGGGSVFGGPGSVAGSATLAHIDGPRAREARPFVRHREPIRGNESRSPLRAGQSIAVRVDALRQLPVGLGPSRVNISFGDANLQSLAPETAADAGSTDHWAEVRLDSLVATMVMMDSFTRVGERPVREAAARIPQSSLTPTACALFSVVAADARAKRPGTIVRVGYACLPLFVADPDRTPVRRIFFFLFFF